ncbi:MAG TPA: methyltransferase domain-containing protein [Planctomycetota bacterium]|nr:methyltransferase domain-containing protein [Planctomycetota bacterium]
MHDALAPEHFADWNEQMILRYDPDVFNHHPRSLVRWVENKRHAQVIRLLAARPEHRILDVGCGAGYILSKLPGAFRHGLDISTFMVKRAQERLGNDATIVQGDAEKLPYPDASFDRVIASSLLSHVLHPEQVVRELRRVVTPNGRVVISVCDEDQIERGMAWMNSLGALGRLFVGSESQPKVYNVEYHLQKFSLPRLREVVGTTLKEIAVRRVPVVFPVHAVAVYTPPLM